MRNKYAVFIGVFTIFSFLSFVKSSAASGGTMADLSAVLSATPSEASAVSFGGSTIVGNYQVGSNAIAFRYAGGVVTNLGVLAGGANSYALRASSDGSVIVGQSDSADGSRAFKYTGAGPMQNLGTIGNASGGSAANGVSGDGLIIVGYSDSPDSQTHAFRYVGTTMTDIHTAMGLNTTDNTYSYANAISNDGSTIVGYYDNLGVDQAFKFDGTTRTDLGLLNGGTYSKAWAVSANGAVVVGEADDINGNQHAFKHQGTTITDLGTLGGLTSLAYAVSADGSVVVGRSDDINGNLRAFKHDGSTMVDLGTLGGAVAIATAVSADGRTIYGLSQNASGIAHAFIYRSVMVDINNTISSLYYNAAQLNSIINLKNSLITNNLNQDCDKFGSSNLCLGVSARYSNVNNHNAQEVAGILKVAYKFNPHLRVGILLDQTVNNSDPSNFVSSNPTPMAVLFSNLAQNSDGSGLNLRLAGSYNKSDLNIRRDNYLANTEAGKGDTSLTSIGLLAQLSYNQKLTNKISISPNLGIRRTEISRKAYTETSGADFPITYAALRQKSTTAIAGVNVNFNLTKKTNLSLGGGVEHNLQSSMDGYDGNISQIGSFSLKAQHIIKNRAFANAGISYDLKENQSISSSIYYGKQQFNNANVAMVYLGYKLGL